MKRILQNFLNKFGIQIERYPSYDLRRRIMLVNDCNINKILDVGASVGQYAKTMRKLGYDGKIISFEPRKAAYEILNKNAEKDKNWETCNYALGDTERVDYINIAGMTDSSSILQMNENHLQVAPKANYVGKEEIIIKTLDSIFDDKVNDDENVMLKIDTQGYERFVLEGAKNKLHKVMLLQLEMSLVTLYDNEMLYVEMIEYLKKKNFKLFSIENGMFNQKSGQLLQIDGLFKIMIN